MDARAATLPPLGHKVAVDATAWFSALMHALTTRDDGRADQARDELRRLGVTVDLLPNSDPSAAERRRGPQPSSVLAVDLGTAASLVGVSRAHFARQVSSGRAPRGLLIGRRRVFLVEELAAWLQAGAPALVKWQALRGGGR